MFHQRHRTTILTTLILSLIITVWAPQPAQGFGNPTPSDPSLSVLIISPGGQSLAAVIPALEDQAVTVRHRFPPDAFIATIPTTVDPATLATSYGLRIFSGPIDPNEVASWSPTAQQAVRIWNALQYPGPAAETRLQTDNEANLAVLPDTFSAPSGQGPATRTNDTRPDYLETSQFFIGSVAVGIVLPESDGSRDPSTEDWTPTRRAQVAEEIVGAMAWWAERGPQAQLSFVYDNITAETVPTTVEPISRPRSGQEYWVRDAMTAMGFQGVDYFDQVRQYNDYLRQTYQTDWAFTIFVVDSEHDPDNMFVDNYFAYAYLGGPFMVMTYGNQNYGIQHMDAVTAHETGHIFKALDQYAASGQGCQLQAGYLGVENQNSELGCASNEPSIMRGRTAPYLDKQLDHYARGQLGWWDSDGDGLPDPVDVGLAISELNWTIGAQPNQLNVELVVEETPTPSPEQRDILINKLETVSYRVDDGPWLAATPVDSRFDSHREPIRFTTDPLPSGSHTIFIRSRDNFGQLNEQIVTTVETVDPVANQLQTEFDNTQSAMHRGEVHTFSGSAQHSNGIISNVEFRLDDQPWRPSQAVDGRFDSPQERFEVVIDTGDLSNGTHLLQVRAVDAQGYVDTTPAWQSLTVSSPYPGGPGDNRVFIPLVSYSR